MGSRIDRQGERQVIRLVALMLAVALVGAGCSDAADDPDGPVIEVVGPYRDGEADAFSEAMVAFTEQTGIGVNYIGTSDLANDIRTALATGTTPDVAILPQPGFIAELALRPDGVLPLPQVVVETIDANYGETGERLGEIDGVDFGVVYKISPKSLIWYPPAEFASRGVAIPQDLDGLESLVKDLTSELSPWCFTMFAFASTGWIVTDWIEDLLLRQAGPEAYDAWVAGDLAFDSPEVRTAMETLDSLVLQQGRAYGGPARYLRNVVSDASLPMFDDPVNCLLHRQAGFAENWLPAEVVPGADTDVFLFPPENAGDDTRLMIGGDTAVMFADTPEIREFMKYLATPESGATWARQGGYTGAHTSVSDYTTYYPHEFDRKLAEAVAEADVLRFDGSDLMPASFAGSSLLQILTSWVSGEISLDKAVADLDEERNKSSGS
jgi:alpha-glucoside transport system substrate-binding protein